MPTTSRQVPAGPGLGHDVPMTTTYVYILPVHGEDWLKLGMSNDPLRRAREFSSRYYEAFDLDRAVLVETDGRADAAALERELRRNLRVHRAPMPLTIRSEAGGHTEWLRGAYPALLDACRDSPIATAVHHPARAWFARTQWEQRAMLDGWARGLMREYLLDPDESTPADLPAPLRAQLQDAVDAYHAFGLRIDDQLPAGLAAWYGGLPGLPAEPE